MSAVQTCKVTCSHREKPYLHLHAHHPLNPSTPQTLHLGLLAGEQPPFLLHQRRQNAITPSPTGRAPLHRIPRGPPLVRRPRHVCPTCARRCIRRVGVCLHFHHLPRVVAYEARVAFATNVWRSVWIPSVCSNPLPLGRAWRSRYSGETCGGPAVVVLNGELVQRSLERRARGRELL